MEVEENGTLDEEATREGVQREIEQEHDEQQGAPRTLSELELLTTEDGEEVEEDVEESGGTVDGEGGASLDLNALEDVVVSEQVYEAIACVLPRNDALDEPDFDPVKYLNQLFPNEQALVGIDTAVSKLKVRILRLDRELSTHVRQLSTAGDRGKQDLVDAQRAIADLFAKIQDIKMKAEQSEVMVQEICSDIKALDYAKKHLSTTITSLKRVHMLVTGVEQLSEWAAKKQYREVGNLLEAVNQLSKYFKGYSSIPRIVSLTSKVEQIRGQLNEQVFEEFRTHDKPGMSNTAAPALLGDVCFVVDALGKKTRKSVMKWFCHQRLAAYKQQFAPDDEYSKLEFTEQRFVWIKRELQYYEKHYDSVFPPTWRVPEMLCEEFCFVTREHLTAQLDEKGCTVQVLLHAIQKTLAFETYLGEYFSAEKYATLINLDDLDLTEEDVEDEEEDEEDEDARRLAELNPHSAEAIRIRYREFQKQQERELRAAKKNKEPPPPASEKFSRIVSACFDPHMDLYTDRENGLMETKVETLLSEERWDIDDDELIKVLQSSPELVYYQKKCMTRCGKLSRKQPLFNLYKIFKTHIAKYREGIAAKLPEAQANDLSLKMTESDERMVCLIVNTAEYLEKKCQELEAAIKKTIDAAFVDAITMQDVRDDFSELVRTGIAVLRVGLLSKSHVALSEMCRLPLASWTHVEDESEYVHQLSTYIHQTVPLYHDWLSNINFRYFCDSYVGACIPLLVRNIFRCKSISEVGAEQLLLDTTSIKTMLLRVPCLTNGPAEGTCPPRYAKLVRKEMGKVEKLLKTILAPPETLVQTYAALVNGGSAGHLSQLMDLKGLSKAEQQTLLEEYEKQKGAE